MKILPLFKSHYSIGKSILTLDKAGSSSKEGSSSIVDIVKENKLDQVFLVEENMSSFLDAFKNFNSIKVPFFYGLRLELCPDINEKTEESLKKCSKIIIFAKNGNGYKKLIKIFSIAATDGFYYTPRIDEKTLTQEWDESSLKLCVPFYDSFLFNNAMSYSLCCPELTFTKPTFFIEDNDLPFDQIVKQKVIKFCSDQYETVPCKSIYYKTREDFKAYLTFRCINNRTTLNKPNLEHMCSTEFSFESWKEANSI